MSSRGIDYSKWDKMDFGDSDSEDSNGGGGASRRPRVTRLDGPSRVTRGPDGAIEIDPSPGGGGGGAAAAAAAAAAGGDPARERRPAGEGIRPPEAVAGAGDGGGGGGGSVPERLTRNGGSFVDATTGSRVCWSQDRDEVTVSVAFDSAETPSRGVRAKATGALPYADRRAAVGSGPHGTLVVSAEASGGGERVLLKGDLPHFVHLAEDEEEVELEIDSLGGGTGRLAKVTLRKAVPMEGVCIWWDQPLAHCPKIDVSTIEARCKKGSVGDRYGGRKNQQKAVKEAWDEAHKMFREKVKARQKESIILPDKGECDGE